jgi:hypothetical protein
MLSNKHFGIAAAAMLGSVALLGINAANAVIDVDVDEPTKSMYAKEALIEDQVIPDTDYYIVGNDSTDNNLHIRVRMDYVATGEESIYVRYDLTGLVFAAQVVEANIREQGESADVADVVSGGDAGDEWVIVGVDATGGVELNDELELQLESIGVMVDRSGSIKVALYDTLDNANSQDSHLKMKSADDVVSVVYGVEHMGSPTEPNPVADVEQDFLMFVEADPHMMDMGNIGGYVVGWKADVRNQDGSMVGVLGDLVVVADSDLSIAGNFSVGAFHLDEMMDCSTTTGTDRTSLVISESDDMAMLEGLTDVEQDGADLDGRYLCIDVEDNEAAIPVSEYTASLMLAKATGRAFDPMAPAPDLIGRITRNGTTVHIPFVTTHARYAQRIILRNRGDKEIEYTIMVHPEEDNGAMPEMLGGNSDMLPAKTTRILLTTDVVMFAEGGGNPRGSATLTANVAPNKISVATSLLNRDDGSTDTMQHEADMQ